VCRVDTEFAEAVPIEDLKFHFIRLFDQIKSAGPVSVSLARKQASSLLPVLTAAGVELTWLEQASQSPSAAQSPPSKSSKASDRGPNKQRGVTKLQQFKTSTLKRGQLTKMADIFSQGKSGAEGSNGRVQLLFIEAARQRTHPTVRLNLDKAMEEKLLQEQVLQLAQHQKRLYLERVKMQKKVVEQLFAHSTETPTWDNPQHRQQMERVWSSMKPDTPFPGTKHERWKELGYQGADPMTDFRGMGMLSVQCLDYWGCLYTKLCRSLIAQQDNRSYPISTAMINVVAVVSEVLTLTKRSPTGGFAHPLMQNPLFSLFARSDTIADGHLFEETACMLLALVDKWVVERGATYMQFPTVLADVKKKLRDTLELEPASFAVFVAWMTEDGEREAKPAFETFDDDGSGSDDSVLLRGSRSHPSFLHQASTASLFSTFDADDRQSIIDGHKDKDSFDIDAMPRALPPNQGKQEKRDEGKETASSPATSLPSAAETGAAGTEGGEEEDTCSAALPIVSKPGSKRAGAAKRTNSILDHRQRFAQRHSIKTSVPGLPAFPCQPVPFKFTEKQKHTQNGGSEPTNPALLLKEGQGGEASSSEDPGSEAASAPPPPPREEEDQDVPSPPTASDDPTDEPPPPPSTERLSFHLSHPDMSEMLAALPLQVPDSSGSEPDDPPPPPPDE